MNDYLFTLPTSFELSSVAFALGMIGTLAAGFSIWYYKKKRARFNLEVEQRKLMRLHAKISLGLMVAYLFVVISRISGIDFLSYRIVGFSLLFATIINVIIALVRILKAKNAEQLSLRTDGDGSYGKYLPKKKKK